MLNVATVIVPTLVATTHAPSNSVLLRAFSRTYYSGRNTAVPLTLISAGLFGYASYAAPLRNARLGFGAATALFISVPLFTVLTMKGGIDKLLRAEGSVKAREKMGMDGALKEVITWARMHWIRTFMAGLGFSSAVWAAFTEV